MSASDNSNDKRLNNFNDRLTDKRVIQQPTDRLNDRKKTINSKCNSDKQLDKRSVNVTDEHSDTTAELTLISCEPSDNRTVK